MYCYSSYSNRLQTVDRWMSNISNHHFAGKKLELRGVEEAKRRGLQRRHAAKPSQIKGEEKRGDSERGGLNREGWTDPKQAMQPPERLLA